MQTGLTRICELLVGLPEVHILGVEDEVNGFVCIYIEWRAQRPGCAHCGALAQVKIAPDYRIGAPRMAMSDRARRWVSDWSGSSNSVPTSKTPTTQSKPVLPGTLICWKHQIAAWHEAQLSNGHTEAAVNNLLKRVKREAFGFTSFRNYRIRSLLYVGPPNCDLLATRSDASFTALPFHRRNSENDSASLNGGVPTPAGLVGARD